ncbi:MAG: CapA family protein [Thermoanaerobacterales bacterium]|nr:CapA family protein [Thermoanaerobacterales bacterium]
MVKRAIAAFVILCAVFLAVLGLGDYAMSRFAPVSQDLGPAGETESEEPEENSLLPPENPTILIGVVGDVMMHEGQIWAGYDEVTGEFDYSEFFEEVKDDISSCDIAIANLETTLAGKERKFTGYPRFNSPDEIADALKEAGFDIIITSNNHCLDRGEEGLLRTLMMLEERDLIAVGTNASEEAKERISCIESNGIKTAILAYTYGTNGIPIPRAKPYLVNMIEEDRILKDLSSAKELCDIVLVYLHFGQEYKREPSAEQKSLALLLLENGADVVLGSHPHVIQPGEWVDVLDEYGRTVKKYVAYSLGNFISAQRFPYTEEGIILQILFEKDLSSDRIIIKDIVEIDTWVEKFKSDGKMRYYVRKGRKPSS